MCLEKILDLWKNALLNPKKTFKKQKRRADLALGAKYVLVAGAIVGFLVGVSSFNWTTTLILIIAYPLIALLGWLLSSGINYVFARLLGGKGNYTTQSYLIALYSAPFSIITVVIMLIPVVGIWLSILVSLYGLYLLTLALKETHKYSTGRAVLTWLLPMIIVVVIVMALVALFVIAYLSYLSPMTELQQILV